MRAIVEDIVEVLEWVGLVVVSVAAATVVEVRQLLRKMKDRE